MVYFRAIDEFLGWATPPQVSHPCRAATGWELHLRNLTAMGFELRLDVGLSVPNGRPETCAARRLSPVLFENMAALQEAWVPDKCFVRNTLHVSTLDIIF
jgi:hypothetical protein